MTEPFADFWTRDIQEAARSRIGSELRRLYGLPDDVPHQMLALLIQLSDDPAGAAFKVGQLHSAVHQAFRKACQVMRVEVEENRADADFIFDKVIEAVKGGESDPDRICSRVLLELNEKSRSRVVALRGSTRSDTRPATRMIDRPRGAGRQAEPSATPRSR